MENTRRKNSIDSYASKEFLMNETMTTYKRSVGLTYADIQERQYKKMEVEVGLPLDKDSSSFVKVDGFFT